MNKLTKFIRTRSKKSVIWLVVLLIAITGVYLVSRIISGPAEGIVQQIPVPMEKPVELKSLSGTYIATKYPGRYEPVSNQNKSASLEYWIIIARQGLGIGQSAQISIVVESMPVGGVKESSAYKNFDAFKDKYSLTKSAYNNEEVFIGSTKDSTLGHTALWPHGKYLLLVTITAPAKSDALLSEFDTVLQNVQWLP